MWDKGFSNKSALEAKKKNQSPKFGCQFEETSEISQEGSITCMWAWIDM